MAGRDGRVVEAMRDQRLGEYGDKNKETSQGY